MKHSILLPAIFFVSTLIVSAQKQPRFFAEFRPQLAIPAGEFAGTDQARSGIKEREGWARTGFAVSVTGGYSFARNWAVLLDLGYRRHGQDMSGTDKELEQDGFNQRRTWSDAWQVFNAFTGIQYQLPLAKDQRFALEFRVLGGAAKVTVPAAGYDAVSTANPGGGPPVLQVESSTGKVKPPVTFGWSAGLGLQYRLNNTLSLGLHAAFTGASPDYHRIYNTVTNDINYEQWYIREKKYPVHAVSAGVGIRYSF